MPFRKLDFRDFDAYQGPFAPDTPASQAIEVAGEELFSAMQSGFWGGMWSSRSNITRQWLVENAELVIAFLNTTLPESE